MTTNLKDKKILVAVCGSIAAYKAAELVRQLRKEEADVTVAMTEAGTKFIGPLTFAAFTTNPVMVEQFSSDDAGVPHVDIAEAYDAMVVAPATADMLGKAAHAVADDLVSTLLNIVDCPILFVPAMNYRMWQNPATQDAVKRLREWGREVLDPDIGDLATLHVGEGRLPAIEDIMSRVRGLLEIPQLWAGQNVIVTAGPTREPIDPVRYISNRSSGRMGYAIAAAARDMGANVTIISGPVALQPVPNCKILQVETANDMRNALKTQIRGTNLLIMAAAAADFTPTAVAKGKIRRNDTPEAVSLEPAVDIIKSIRDDFDGMLVAFSLQQGLDLENARKKMQDKHADSIIVNAYDEKEAGFDSATNHVWILDTDGNETELPMADKAVIARQILTHLAERGRGN